RDRAAAGPLPRGRAPPHAGRDGRSVGGAGARDRPRRAGSVARAGPRNTAPPAAQDPALAIGRRDDAAADLHDDGLDVIAHHETEATAVVRRLVEVADATALDAVHLRDAQTVAALHARRGLRTRLRTASDGEQQDEQRSAGHPGSPPGAL